MIFSVTEREVYKRCERRWALSSENMQYLQPVQNAPALSLGGLVQAALSEWTEDPTVDPIASYTHLGTDHLEKVVLSYTEHHGFSPSDAELDPLYTAILLGAKMVENYMTYYHEPRYKAGLPIEYIAIKTEQRALVDIPKTEHLECANGHCLFKFHSDYTAFQLVGEICDLCGEPYEYKHHQLRGTMDTLIRDRHNKFYILERKTYGNRPSPDKLQHDDQQLGYLWVMRQLFGRNAVGGVFYDGLWKRELTAKRPIEDLFYREVFIRPNDELDEFERLLPRECQRMAEAKMIEFSNLTINRPWGGCWDCGFNKLCASISRGEDSDYVKAEFYQSRTEQAPLEIVEDDGF